MKRERVASRTPQGVRACNPCHAPGGMGGVRHAGYTRLHGSNTGGNTPVTRSTAAVAPTRPKSRPWLLSAGKPGYRAGRLHRQIRRAFTANGSRQLSTSTLLVHCYPKVRKLNLGTLSKRLACRVGDLYMPRARSTPSRPTQRVAAKDR